MVGRVHGIKLKIAIYLHDTYIIRINAKSQKFSSRDDRMLLVVYE